MSELLTNDPNHADALLDMSNILRDPELGGRGPADLIRLERVGEALANLYKTPQIAMFGIADNSLIMKSGLFLDPHQQRTIRHWAQTGLILTEGKADTPLLRIAWETGLPIITHDRFGGHRREFPWLDGSEDAVLEPRANRHGEIKLHHVTLSRRTEWEMSVSEENDLLVQQGLTQKIEVLGRFWSCPEPRCSRHDPTKGAFVLLPLGQGNRLICDQHGLDMIDLGSRPRRAQLKIMINDTEAHRFTIEQGHPATVGREPGPGNLTPYLDDSMLRGVSRTHLRFDLDADRLMITDLSRNGTLLFPKHGERIDFRHATRPFSVGDRAEICPGLEIIRSGRRYPSELTVDRRVARIQSNEPPPPTVSF